MTTIGFWNIAKFTKAGAEAHAYSLMNQCDIACFQEWKAGRVILGVDSYRNTNAFERDGDACGVLTTWKSTAPCLEAAAKYTTDVEFWVKTRKSSLITRHVVEGHPLLVINVHGFNGWPLKKVEPLLRQLNQLMDTILAFDGPIVVGGDFNTSTDARLDAVNTFFKDLDFSEHIATDYPKSHRTLDHVYGRGCGLLTVSRIQGGSDHTATVVGVKL